MLPNDYKLPFGIYSGVKIQTIKDHRSDYVRAFLSNSELCEHYPGIKEYFLASTYPPVEVKSDAKEPEQPKGRWTGRRKGKS